ncbi:MAG: DNA methyltransferase [bacterium]
MEIIEKFQNLLKKIFQFDSSDLDFGIYKIFNFKKEQITKFIDEDIPEKIENSFKKYKNEQEKSIEKIYENRKEQVIKTLGKNVFTSTYDIKEQFRDMPLSLEYINIKEQLEEIRKIDEIKLQVFNDIYNFFSLYYKDGDFIPQYRYSIKNYKYAIPYNGEEVRLYWANADQYYTKTGLLFKDYIFKSNDYKVIFRIASAKDEVASNKATKERFFIFSESNYELLDQRNSFIDNQNKKNNNNFNSNTYVIYFEYRELIDEEVKFYNIEGGSNGARQEKINQKSYETIISNVKDIYLKNALAKEKETSSKENSKTILLYHIGRFTAKNTNDYFIHKNLKKFLSEQLNYFIKSEVLDADILENDKFLDKHITRAKTVREIGESIIDFLAQIEDFQKKLWEKKKFVLKTEYVITLDRIKKWTGEKFLKEVVEIVIKNKSQLNEWKELGFENIEEEEDLIEKGEIKKLPIDTKYFENEFKLNILEKITENNNLNDILDGVLIKSENWQALNTISNQYREKIQTIYIDPPFNLGTNADFLYNVNYKDSSWISILENRLNLARILMSDRGSIFVRCDYNGNMYVRLLMNNIFGEDNFRNEIVLRKANSQGPLNNFNPANESLFYYSNSISSYFKPIFKERNREVKWVNCLSPKENKEKNTVILFEKEYKCPQGQHWRFSQEKFDKLISEKRIRINEKTSIPQYLEAEAIPLDTNWTDIQGYTFTVGFQTENAEVILQRVVDSSSEQDSVILDFFLGSGTTTAVAHKLGRKWLGIEMGEHFYTVILPRMKKVLAYDKSGISKEKNVKEKYNDKNAGGFFKYQVLEQYEDTLDNIEFQENQHAVELFKDEYLLKYFINFETQTSPYFLSIDMLKTPFLYKLKVNLSEIGEPQEIIADIPETFNYLLGIKINKIKSRLNKRQYLFILGERESKNYAIVWRDYSNDWSEEEFMEDRDFIINEISDWSPQVVYINAQSNLTAKIKENNVEIRSIDADFKRFMQN